MLVVAVSSRALFNLEHGQDIYQNEGAAAFDAYMRANEKKVLQPGAAFPLVKKLLALNTPGKRDRVDVMLLSSNSLEAGARVMSSVRHYGLDIERAFFTTGGTRLRIAKAANVTLFLSTNPDEVRAALAVGIAAGTVMPHSRINEEAGISESLLVAFDGDSVLFDDAAEKVNQAEGLTAFQVSEQALADIPLGDGPFKAVLEALHRIQASFEGAAAKPLRVALVTARGVPACERVVNTFRTWGVQVDDSLFLGGLPKGPFLAALGAELFFDDGMHNCESALQYVPTCHVPYGVVGAGQYIASKHHGYPQAA
jgi:5'-nucleotidase